MLQIILSWRKNSIFFSFVPQSKDDWFFFYPWPQMRSQEFLEGLKLFLICSKLPIFVKIKYLQGPKKKISQRDLKQKYIVAVRKDYDIAFAYGDFICSYFDFSEEREKDRKILDYVSFCNKYMIDNPLFKKIKLKYTMDIFFPFSKKSRYLKIQFNSIDFIQGFLSLTSWINLHAYEIIFGQIYENHQLAQIKLSHLNLFYSRQTLKLYLLKNLKNFYSVLIDLILDFFSLCIQNNGILYDNDENQSCCCGNFALDDFGSLCYMCASKSKCCKEQSEPPMIHVEISIRRE